MRLRNLYEAQVQPGERKGISLKLQRIEDIQVKVAGIQSTIDQLGGVDVPDALKKQMEDLINSAKIEKEKIYAEISDKEAKNPRIQGIPKSVVRLLKGINKNASTIMNAYQRTGKFLYRGIKSDEDAVYGKPFDQRRAKDSNAELSNILNNALASQGFAARRDNTTFTSGSYSQASGYGTVYIIFPRDGFNFHYSKKIGDLVLDTGKLYFLLDKEKVKVLQATIESNWEKLKPYFSYRYPGDKFFNDYDYKRDFEGLQKAVEDGVLPKEFANYKSLEDLVTPEKVIDYMDYNQTDLDDAIVSAHEVMVTGPYYAIRNDKFKDYLAKYLEITKSGTFDITPDTKSEKDKFNKSVDKAAGDSGTEFEIGSWVEHKYENFKGEVVDAYHTNDFVQIKDYTGKIKVVNKKNLNKIETPTIPDYQVGDKIYLRTKGTEWEFADGKKYVVTAVDDLTVTINKGYGTTIPKLLTEPAPKYDTNDPTSGDTVHVTGGDFKGHYGVINYVSSYSKQIDIEMDDGSVVGIDKGNYEVIDPGTKPADYVMVSPFNKDEYVKINDDGNDYSGIVATVSKPGMIKTTVKLFGTNEFGDFSVYNNRIKKIDEPEFVKKAFKIGDEVLVVSGKHRGKTGTFRYLSWDGIAEIRDKDNNIFEVSAKYLIKKEFDKNPSAPEPDSTNTIQKGDFVRISEESDIFPGTVAKVVIKNSKEKSTLLVYGDSDFDHIIDTKLLTKISPDDFEKGAFKKGDQVKIVDGPQQGKIGKIDQLKQTGLITVILDEKTGDADIDLVPIKFFPSSLEKITEPASKADDDNLIDLDDIDFDLDFEPMDEPIAPKKDKEKDAILDKAKQTKKITYSDIEKLLSSNDPPPEEVSKMFDMLEKLGIEVTGYEELVAPSEETPQELQARINDPEVKQNLKIALQNSEVKELIKAAIENKIYDTEFIYKVSNLVGYDTYLLAVKPYLEIKGVQYEG